MAMAGKFHEIETNFLDVFMGESWKIQYYPYIIHIEFVDN
jgi:hypothetical protein